jgi:hypothetical protein
MIRACVQTQALYKQSTVKGLLLFLYVLCGLQTRTVVIYAVRVVLV